MVSEKLNFDRDLFWQKIGQKVGFVVAYFLTTSILFLVLSYLGKLPPGWSYFSLMILVLAISSVAILIKDFFK
jgi:hypothetical protein